MTQVALDPEKAQAPQSSDASTITNTVTADPEKGAATADAQQKTSKITPWRKYGSKNPLRWRELPPLPEKREISKEATAGILSRLTFTWMGDLVRVCSSLLAHTLPINLPSHPHSPASFR